MEEAYERRRALTFAQAEGAAPLPAQLDRKRLSPEIRAKLWDSFYSAFTTDLDEFDGLGSPWDIIARQIYVDHLHGMVDEYRPYKSNFKSMLKGIFAQGDYIAVYGLVHFVVGAHYCPLYFKTELAAILETCRSPYRVVGGDALVPLGTEAEAEQIEAALVDTQKSGFAGAYSHLKAAAASLGAGKNADAIRESIHAVESAARQISGTSELGAALTKLEAGLGMHGAMKKAFGALYGYASNEQGIRHPLLDGGDAKVDETDAVFMLGACASFVSYLIAKARAAGLA